MVFIFQNALASMGHVIRGLWAMVFVTVWLAVHQCIGARTVRSTQCHVIEIPFPSAMPMLFVYIVKRKRNTGIAFDLCISL